MSIAKGLLLHLKDNVATLLCDAEAGQLIDIADTDGCIVDRLEILEIISRGHKVALRKIGVGEMVMKYGEEIGRAVLSMQRGAWVHVHNLASCRGRGDLNEK